MGKGRQEDGTGGLPKGATGRDGIITDFKIIEWMSSAFWRDQNCALRADGWIAIDVDAYDDKVGDQTLAALEEQLGELPATITSTAREPWLPDGSENESRQRFYRVPAGLNFITRLTDIEIVQRSHRYSVVWPSVHPTTGQTYTWYDYEGEPMTGIPSVDDFEELPEAWLNALLAPETTVTGEGFAGGIGEWVERLPDTEPSGLMREWIASLPTTDFGHDVMIALQASIVNLATMHEPGVRRALFALRDAWLRGEYNTPEYSRDFDTSLEGAIGKFGAFAPSAVDVPAQDQAAIAGRISDPAFLGLWTGLPLSIAEISLDDRVARIMSIAYDAGLGQLEAATLGWHSAAARTPGGLRPRLGDDVALQAIWQMAAVVASHPVHDERTGVAPLVAPEAEYTAPPLDRTVGLLDFDERAHVANTDWWGEEFMRVQASLNSVMSEQYYRLNRWMILSLVFANKAVIPFENGTALTLNFYGITVGPTTTGKSESLEPVLEIPKLFWAGTDNPDIGGDATSAALTQALIRRDGLTSFFHADEADATIANWKNQKGEFHGMSQRITDIYTGRVPALQRATQKDISGIHAKAYLNVHLTGIDYKIAEAIEPGDWETGFVNRFVWAKGEEKTVTSAQKRVRVRRDAGTPDGPKAPNWNAQWVAQFNSISNTTLRTEVGGELVWIDIADDVLDRDVETQERLERLAAAHGPYRSRLAPTFRRLHKTILKCAALVAITQRRRQVQMSDYLIALEQAEEWIVNIIEMVEATNMSARARRADRLAELIEAHGGRMPQPQIFAQPDYAGDYRFATGLIDELIAQGRADRLPLSPPIIRLVKEAQ